MLIRLLVAVIALATICFLTADACGRVQMRRRNKQSGNSNGNRIIIGDDPKSYIPGKTYNGNTQWHTDIILLFKFFTFTI